MTEYSELQAVDIAFGGYILGAFKGLSMASDIGPSEFREFLSRADNKKVFRHDSESVQGFLKSYLASDNAVDTLSAGKRVRTARMPVVNYCRHPGLISSDENIAGIYNRLKILFQDNVAFNVRVLGVVLSYRLVFIARDKPTIDKLSLAWLAHVGDTRKGKHKFITQHMVGGQSIEITAVIRDPKSILFQDESIAADSGRFFAVGTTIEIETPVLFGDVVTIHDPLRIEYVGVRSIHG